MDSRVVGVGLRCDWKWLAGWSIVGLMKVVCSCDEPQLNHNSTQPNITSSWVRHENDFAHHPTTHRNSMSAISQLLLTRFWWNFKHRFLGTSRIDSNYQVDICTGNICPGNIFPYQEYLSCYWPDFDGTLKVACWKHLEQIPTIKLTFVQATFVLVTFVHIRNISTVADPILMKL